MARTQKGRVALVSLLMTAWTISATTQTAHSSGKTSKFHPSTADVTENSDFSNPWSARSLRMSSTSLRSAPGLPKKMSRTKRSNDPAMPTTSNDYESTSNTALLSVISPSFPRPSQPTPQTSATTPDPSCRQRKTVEKARVSASLSEVDLSRVMEMCMSLNENPFPIMFNLMNRLSAGLRKDHTQLSIKREDHAQNERSHMTLIQQLIVSDFMKTVCLGPRPRFKPNSVYNLAEVKGGATVYLVTGKNPEWGSTPGERLIFTSTQGHVVSVTLGTTKMWRIFGFGASLIQVKGQHEMNIIMGGLNVSLSRHVSQWSAIYTVSVYFLRENPSAYAGMLGDIIKGDKRISRQLQVSYDDQECFLLRNDPRMYKLRNKYQFAQVFLDLMHDLSKNLPSDTYYYKKEQPRSN